MSGIELSPQFSAELAANVYLIKDEFSRKGFILKYKDSFELDGDSMVKGTTGGYIIKKKHVMAFLSLGKGKYAGQAFVAIKGTASLYDALTDLNAGVHSSHTGFSVHQGFYYAFDTILYDLKRFVSGLKGVNVIHCVGHSLGGAIATLAADWIKVNSGASAVRLYTFGSPRVGLESFAQKCTSRLIADNIYRVSHSTDPVPMVPTWPFYHVPSGHAGYVIDKPMAIKPWEYHLMKHYIKSTEKAGDWGQLKSLQSSGQTDSAVERWLKSDSIIVSMSARVLDWLNSAIVFVIKKIMKATGIVIVTGAAVTLTLLDRLAMLMAKGIKIVSDLSVWVFYLVKKMAQLIGMKIQEGADLSYSLIRFIFLRLHRKISDMIWRIGQEVS